MFLVPRTTSDHIAAYRQQIAAVRQNSVPEEDQQPAVDLFADMVPDIKRQRKVFLALPSNRGEERITMEVTNTHTLTHTP